MRATCIGIIFALIQTIHTEIMLVDDVGLKNSPTGSKTLSDVAQHLRRNYGHNVSVVGGFPGRGYVNRGPQVENYVPVSNVLHGLNPVITNNPRLMPGMVPGASLPQNYSMPHNSPISLAQGYKRPSAQILRHAYHPFPKKPAGTSENHLIRPSSPSIPKPSLGPVYSPILNPEISVAKSIAQNRDTQKTKSASAKSKPSPRGGHKTASSSLPEHPKGGESSDYEAEIDMPEKEPSEAEKIFPDKSKTREPVSDDLDIFPLSEETVKSKPHGTKDRTTTQKLPKSASKTDSSIKIDSPIKIDVPKGSVEEPASEDVLKAAREISSILIPRMRKKGYAKRHNSNIQSAGKARQSYLDYKLIESQESQKSIERKLDALRDLYSKISSKLKSLRDERDLARSRIFNARSTLENNESTVKSLQEEIVRNEGQIKLEEIEIVKLERAINEEKNKLLIFIEQQKIYQNRLESFGGREGTKREELKSNENQLKDYDRLLEQIEKDAESLRARISETETRRRFEIDTQNRLEIEKKEVEDNNHLPLFALYD